MLSLVSLDWLMLGESGFGVVLDSWIKVRQGQCFMLVKCGLLKMMM